MSKKISLSLIVPGILAVPFVALAQLHSYGSGYTIQGIIPKLEMAAGLVFGAIAVICFILAGILFLTAQGEPEKLKAARLAVIGGVAGVVVGIIAFSIIAIVLSIIK